MEKIVIDTSAVYALLDKSDRHHEEAKANLIRLSKENRIITITNFIVAECHAIISGKLGHELGRRWLTGLCWPVERVTEKDEENAKAIIQKYTDKSFSYTDATTFAVMERLGVVSAFAFDKHFTQYGFKLYC